MCGWVGDTGNQSKEVSFEKANVTDSSQQREQRRTAPQPTFNSRTVPLTHALSFTKEGYGLIVDLAWVFPDGVSSCELINHPHMAQTSAKNLQSMSAYKNFFVSEWLPKLCASEPLDTRCELMPRDFVP